MSKKRRFTTLDDIEGLNNGTTPEGADEPQTDEPVQEDPVKNAAAVFLGRLGGLKGGDARAKRMTKAQRSDSARVAALARWRRKKPNP
jgi:hypothetical protein